MSASGISFHLVDRIVDIDLDRGAHGTLEVPAEGGAFPACMVVEAIGQLAAWIAMRRQDFERRPVAALAGDVRVHASCSPGRRIDLEVTIRSCKQVAISYDGVARMDGATIVELFDAAGAMMPMTEFEAPEVARARFERLLGDGLPPRRFPNRASFAPRVLARQIGGAGTATSELEVAPAGSLYGDHFPRRAVYPATLLLDAQLRLALELGREAGLVATDLDDELVGARVQRVKVRSFTPPGSRVAIAAEVLPDRAAGEESLVAIAISSTLGDRRTSSATVRLPRATYREVPPAAS